MPDYKISIDLPSSQEIEAIVNQAVLPKVAQAIRAIAVQAQINWQDAVSKARLWSGEKTPYIESIKINYLTPFSAEIVSDYKYAADIETGRPPRDLKQMLNTSDKVRRTKDGRRFLVIPLRHNTPGNDALGPAMPTSVYNIAKNMSKSKVVSQGFRRSGEVTILSAKSGMRAAKEQPAFLSTMKGRRPGSGMSMHHLVNKNHYSWGDSMTPQMLSKQSKADQKRYGGMKRMATSTGGSSFLTFRVMMEGSSGWIIPAQPGKYIAKKVADDLGPLADKVIQEAFKRTLDN